MREYSLTDWIDKPIDEVIAEKTAEGFDVYKSSPQTLLLDLDTPEALERYEELLPMARRLFNVFESERWVSKGGQGIHIILDMDEPLDATTRIAIQACLGSDPRRELLGLMRMRNGEPEPGLLFRPRRKYGRKNKSSTL